MLHILLTIEVLVVGQINAGPAPETFAEAFRINLVEPGVIGMMAAETPFAPSRPFPIQRYLALAERIQKLPEAHRVTFLRMLARSETMNEPGVLLAFMLITADEGVRPFNPLGAAEYIGSATASQFRDAPLIVFEGVPFLVARSSHSGWMGPPMDRSAFATFVDHLIQNGEWRKDPFHRRSADDLTKVASRLIAHLRDSGLGLSPRDEKFLWDQVSVPLAPPSSKANE